MILKFFLTISLKAHACFHRPEYLNEWNLCCKILKYCILSEVCMINSAPQSTVWPQMWCIKSIKGCFTPPRFKFSTSKYRLTSDVMYKKYQRLFYTPQICWQVNLSNAKKIRPDLFSKNLFSRPNLPWSRAAISLKCDRSLLLFLCVCAYKAINSM